MIPTGLSTEYEDMEISTQILIRDARSLDIQVEIIDRSENFIRLTKGNHSEFIKEATKTRLDSLMTYLVMENKIASKIVLSENKIRIPYGKNYSKVEDALKDFQFFESKKKVIKPVTTNYGIGISIASEFEKINVYQQFLERAFNHSGSVIVEEFIEGPEYRFLVVGDDVLAVCNRKPANVVGDGVSTVSRLIEIKNSDPRRGVGHKTALEKIQMTDIEKEVLAGQGFDFTSIISLDQIVYLRKNSNISTGGDSVDVTDFVHPDYKKIALASAKAAQAVLCGVDIISTEIENKPDPEKYAVLEINFNPVLYIHEFPYQGTSRPAGRKLLELLGFT